MSKRTYSKSKTGHKRRRRRRGINPRVLLCFAIILVIVIIGAIFAFRRYGPTTEQADVAAYYGLESDDAVFLTVNDQAAEANGLMKDGEVYIPVETVQELINSRFYWDSTENILRYVTADSIVSAEPGTNEYMIDRASVKADQAPVIQAGGQAYLSLTFIAEYTNIHFMVSEDPNRAAISSNWGEITYDTLKKATALRTHGGNRSAVITELEKGTKVTVTQEFDDWVGVTTADGLTGYVKRNALGSQVTEIMTSAFEEEHHAHIVKDFAINMAWHQVTNQTANTYVSDVLADTKGINVISPTWFYLDDNEGGIASLASQDYVSWCHQNGIEVWALVSNLENAEVDSAKVLNVTSHRDALVNNLIAAAISYNLDGINVDMESLKSEVGYGFIEFIRELAVKCGNNGIVLSVDNYPPSAHTSLYARSEQAEFADYVILMGYDEHYAGSEEGSVASLPFVKSAVMDTLEEVPASQLVLGCPFYTRVWIKTPDDSEAGYSLDSQAVAMGDAEALVEENDADRLWLEDLGQYYAEYEKDGVTYQVWLEEETSLEEKLKVMAENRLAGASFWKLGFEKDSVWDIIVKYTG